MRRKSEETSFSFNFPIIPLSLSPIDFSVTYIFMSPLILLFLSYTCGYLFFGTVNQNIEMWCVIVGMRRRIGKVVGEINMIGKKNP
jgi:hypothetical protein